MRMPVKLTMVFHHVTQTQGRLDIVQRVSKWRESLYSLTDDLTTARLLALGGGPVDGGVGILMARRTLLTPATVLTDYYLQRYELSPSLGEVGIGRPEKHTLNFFGFFGPPEDADIPQQAALVRVGFLGGHPGASRYHLRGIPDSQVIRGELRFSAQYRKNVEAYLARLRMYGTYVDDRVTVAGQGQGVESIDVDGLVVGVGPLTILAMNQLAKVTRTTNQFDRQTGGIYRVAAINDPPGTVRLADWDRGPTEGGNIRRWTRVMAPFNHETARIVRSSLKKVGSPRQYIGRNRFPME
jgi:hypothetical protein